MSFLGKQGLLIPEGWIATRMSNVADVVFSNVDKHTLEGETLVRLCNYVDVYKNDCITKQIDFMEASATLSEIAQFQIKKNDVLATKDSETPTDIAIPALVTQELPGVLCGYHLALLRPRSKRLIGPFLYWLHESKQFRAHYECEAVGVTRFWLGQYSFRSAPLCLPPAPEQKRIAAYLDASCRAIDAAAAAKREQIKILTETLASRIETAVTSGIRSEVRKRPVAAEWMDEVPAHWKVVRIKRILVRMDYGISVSTTEEGKYQVLKMGHLDAGEIRVRRFDYVDEVASSLLLERNDILYNRTNSPDLVGKAAIFRGTRADQITFASYLVRLRVDHNCDPEFVNYVLNCDGFLDFARKLAIPSVQQSNLNSTRYGGLWIPLPSLPEQNEIASKLNRIAADCARTIDVLRQQIETLSAYRQSLIQECVTGQRRVTQADLVRVEAHA